jgi:hypothetical protein
MGGRLAASEAIRIPICPGVIDGDCVGSTISGALGLCDGLPGNEPGRMTTITRDMPGGSMRQEAFVRTPESMSRSAAFPYTPGPLAKFLPGQYRLPGLG